MTWVSKSLKGIDRPKWFIESLNYIYKTMLSHFLKRRKNTESKHLGVGKANKGKPIVLWNCTVQDSKNQDLSKNKKLVCY